MPKSATSIGLPPCWSAERERSEEFLWLDPGMRTDSNAVRDDVSSALLVLEDGDYLKAISREDVYQGIDSFSEHRGEVELFV